MSDLDFILGGNRTYSDVVFKTPLRAFIISSGVIVLTCPRDRGSRKACRPDYEPISAADLPIPDSVCRTALETSLVTVLYAQDFALWRVSSHRSLEHLVVQFF